MTGTIKTLSTRSVSGAITSDQGLRLQFDLASVSAYDAAALAVGQIVTFDLEAENSHKAINILVERFQHGDAPERKRPEQARLRYMGFEQAGSVRIYRFERNPRGEEKITFAVTSDIALFTKHHIAIQDGPALCLQLLSSEPDAGAAAAQPMLQRFLTDQDMLVHIARRPAPRKKLGPPRRPQTWNVHGEGAAAGKPVDAAAAAKGRSRWPTY